MTDAEKSTFAENAARLLRELGQNYGNTAAAMLEPRLVACDAAEESLTLAFPSLPWERNPGGVIHGGMVGAMFDTALGIATYALTNRFTPTVSLTTSYLRPAPGEGTLIVHARITRAGHSLLYASAEMWEARTPDETVATAQAVFHRYRE